MKEEWIVDGYLFRSEEDAALAEQEKKKIKYLRIHMNYHNAENVLQIYEKLLQERVFQTPVGYAYLKELQEYLAGRKEIQTEKIPPVHLQNYYSMNMRKSYAPARQYVKAAEKTAPRWPLFSLLLNVLLAAAVVAMFMITLKSENPNILNYEKNLLNKYAGWEQELNRRESIIRERERELHISVE